MVRSSPQNRSTLSEERGARSERRRRFVILDPRWPLAVLGLLLVILGGCSNTCFVRECDYEEFSRRLNIPKELETHPEAAIAQVDASGPEPTTVLDPDRPPRYITLQEAIAIALEQGMIGS